MSQLAIDFHPRAEPIAAVYDKANEVIDGWGDLAMQFLRTYAMRHERVFGEDVTKASLEWGMVQPHDQRAWGGVYIRAQREGILLDDGKTRKRANGNKAANYRSRLWR